jgi:phage terminase large subunit-like protein
MMNQDGKRSFSEEIEIAGHQLVERIKALMAEGNVRRLRIHTGDGGTMLEIPLTAGAIAGGVVALTAPWLAAIAALAGLATNVRIEIVRDDDKPDDAAK